MSNAMTGMLLAVVGMPGGCSLCGNRMLQRQESPTRAWTAVVYERDCGATTSVQTVVELLPRGSDRPDEDDPSGVVISIRNPQHLTVQWMDDSHLRVLWSGCIKVNFPEERKYVKSVSIEYVRTGG